MIPNRLSAPGRPGSTATRIASATLGVAIGLAPVVVSHAPATALPEAARGAAAADSLARHAHERLKRGSPDDRRHAREDLEQAVRIDPGRSDLWLALGKLRLDIGHAREGRSALERAAALAPADAACRVALGGAFKREWLESLDGPSFRLASEWFARATVAAPDDPEAWLEATGLALVRGDARLSAACALGAHDADPEGGLPKLALACAAYRLGRLHLADSLFSAARAVLPDSLARRFDDASLLGAASPARAGGPATAAAVAASPDSGARGSAADFWADLDPDPTTPENEARLGYLARLGHAILLFRSADRVHWDVRTELVVRYGLPASIERNRASGSLQSFRFQVAPESGAERVEFGYPYQEQVWAYPALGMRVVLWDRHLTGSYSLPVSERWDPDPRPSPAALASRPDLVALGGGRGVYRALAPGLHPRPASVQLSRFPTEGGVRLVAHLTTPGAPGDTLRGSWVVLGAGRRERARDVAPLGVSACDPTGARTAEFAADLPPGEYDVAFAVDDARGGRGLVKRSLRVAAPDSGLAISDLVVVCGGVASAVADRQVRIQPAPEGRVTGRGPLAVYFEISRLAAGGDGRSRFEFRYRVRRAADAEDPRRATPPEIEASREESHAGRLRRQFLEVPLARLAPGPYTLEIEVRDLLANVTVRERADFVLAGPDGAAGRRR